MSLHYKLKYISRKVSRSEIRRAIYCVNLSELSRIQIQKINNYRSLTNVLRAQEEKTTRSTRSGKSTSGEKLT